MIDFVFELASCRHRDTYLPFYPEHIRGYTEEEVDQIAEIYNLDIHGQFREFLLQMGRCSGGLLWGHTVSMYCHTWRIEDYKFQQEKIMEDELSDPTKGMIDAIQNKFFSLTMENEGCYFAYLVTARQDDNVWAFDYGKTDHDFTDVGCTLLEYLKWLVTSETKQARFYERDSTFEKDKKYITGRLL